MGEPASHHGLDLLDVPRLAFPAIQLFETDGDLGAKFFDIVGRQGLLVPHDFQCSPHHIAGVIELARGHLVRDVSL